MRILVVEDERAIADFLERGLRSEGYAVNWASDGEEAELMALTGDYSLILLDVLLPKKSGLEVLRTVRKQLPELPIILLTARGEIEQKVEGLDLGANDYVVKPFSFDELMARVRAHLRAPSQSESSSLTAGDIALDFTTREVLSQGQQVHLTAREFELLVYFMRHPSQVLSRQQILNAVWGYDYDPGTNVVDVYVGYLRKKLATPGNPNPIETVRSAGYRLVVEG